MINSGAFAYVDLLSVDLSILQLLMYIRDGLLSVFFHHIQDSTEASLTECLGYMMKKRLML